MQTTTVTTQSLVPTSRIEKIKRQLNDCGYLLKQIELPECKLITALEWWNVQGHVLILQLHADDSYELFLPVTDERSVQRDKDFITSLTINHEY